MDSRYSALPQKRQESIRCIASQIVLHEQLLPLAEQTQVWPGPAEQAQATVCGETVFGCAIAT
jgi:hypothetical protein